MCYKFLPALLDVICLEREGASYARLCNKGSTAMTCSSMNTDILIFAEERQHLQWESLRGDKQLFRLKDTSSIQSLIMHH